MKNPSPDSDANLSLSKVVRIDQICDRFDRAIHEAIGSGGPWPAVEDYLGDAAEPLRGELRKQLSAVEASCRQQHAEGAAPLADGRPQASRRQPGESQPRPGGDDTTSHRAEPPPRASARQPQRAAKGNDRNLLFGILALQMDFIGREALVTAMNTWVLAKDQPLGSILVGQKALAADSRDLLEALVQKHLAMHDNDPEKSLAAVGSAGLAREDLRQIADPDLQASLVSLSEVERRLEHGATQTLMAGSGAAAGTRFRILRFHKEGGLGKVSVARDEELGRDVALKEIKERHADVPENRARFLLEAEITGGLEHPGIVPVYSLGQYANGRPFYAMRFIRGDSLKEAVDRYHDPLENADPGERAVELRRLLGRFIDVCNAIAYAHSRGVLHRDLKPGNIMLGKYGETLVVDWGLAKCVDRADVKTEVSQGPIKPSSSSGSADTEMGSVLGTAHYMSPEQASGQLDQLGPASDVYSLGATLYYLLTGQRPIESNDLATVLQKVQRGEFRPPRAVKPEIARPLEAICLKAMALAPGDRYASPKRLAEDLECWLADEPVIAYREPWARRLRRWCKKHRRLLVRSALTAVIAGLLALSGIMIRENDRNRRRAEAFARTEEAKQHLAKFRSLADERQFYAGLIAPASERNLQYDTQYGEKAGAEALQLAAEYGDWDALPESDRNDFQREYHDLLLLSVQSQIQNSSDRTPLDELLGRLDKAAALAGPSRSLCLLRQRCYQARGKNELAARQAELASQFPATSLSHFLEGEWLRMEAGALRPIGGDGAELQPDADKLKAAVEHYQKALNQKALNQDPEIFWCHFQMGRSYLGLEMRSEALAALDTCVALRPKQPWAYSVRGLILALDKNYKGAELDLDKALELRKAFGPALLNRGYLFMTQKKYREALADFAQALELPADEKLLAAAFCRGQAYLALGEKSKALADFELVKDQIRAAYLTLFAIDFRDGDVKQSLNQLTQYINAGRNPPLDDKNWELHYLRGLLLGRLVGSAEGGKALLQELETAERLGGRSASLYYELGAAHYYGRRPDKAVAYLTKAWDAAPGDPLAAAALRDLRIKILNLRGWTYAQRLERPDYEKASGDFAQVLNRKVDPQNAEAYSGLGFVYARQGQIQEAQSAAGMALAYGAGKYLVLHNVACIYAELSVSDKPNTELHAGMAIKYIRRELELNPKALVDVRKEAEMGGAFYTLRKRQAFIDLVDGG
jgi:serine/threonine protein kinase/tetratricopeptide (TPR) repeat protein